MRLAPLVRTQFDSQRREELDDVLNKKSETTSLNIFDLNFKPGRKSGPTWPVTREAEMENDVEIIGKPSIHV